MDQTKEFTMNEDLTKARALLKNIHVMDENIIEPTIVDHPKYTILITSDDLEGLRRPFAEVISNADLLILYDYTIRCWDGDPAFDDFEGHFMDSDDFTTENIFADLYYALVETDIKHVSHVMNYEDYAVKKLRKKRLIRRFRVISGGSNEDRQTNIPDSPF